jgi:hypothetical protein
MNTVLTVIFIVSGLFVAVFLLAKMREMRTKKPFFLLRAVSQGDHRVRDVYQSATNKYSDAKEKGKFWVTKQLPLQTKTLLSKAETLVKEKSEKYIGNIRNSRLLGDNREGISEFFKNLSEKEEERAEENADSENRDKIN